MVIPVAMLMSHVHVDRSYLLIQFMLALKCPGLTVWLGGAACRGFRDDNHQSEGVALPVASLLRESTDKWCMACPQSARIERDVFQAMFTWLEGLKCIALPTLHGHGA